MLIAYNKVIPEICMLITVKELRKQIVWHRDRIKSSIIVSGRYSYSLIFSAFLVVGENVYICIFWQSAYFLSPGQAVFLLEFQAALLLHKL